MTSTDRYRKIDTRIRADSRFRALSAPPPNARDLWLHLLTCGHDRSVPGLHAVGLAQLADEMEWSVEDTRRVWEEIEAEGMATADWGARVVWIPNALAHNRPQSINVVRSWRRAWGEITECALKAEARIASAKVIAEKSEALAEAFLQLCHAPKLRDSARKSIADAFEKHEPMLSRSIPRCFRDRSPDEIETHDHQAQSTKHDHKIPPNPPSGDSANPEPIAIERGAEPEPPRALPLAGYVEAWNRGVGTSKIAQAQAPSRRTEARDRKLSEHVKRFADPAEWEWCARALATSDFHCGSSGWGPASLGWLLERGQGSKLDEWMSKGAGLRDGSWAPPQAVAEVLPARRRQSREEMLFDLAENMSPSGGPEDFGGSDFAEVESAADPPRRLNGRKVLPPRTVGYVARGEA